VTRADLVNTPGSDDDQPEWWRRALRMRRVPIITAIVLGVIVLKATTAPKPPSITTSCTKPAFVLSTYSTTQHHTVQWAATGPSTMTFAITIGVNHFVPTGNGHLAPVPDSGVSAHVVRSTVPQSFGSDCKATGSFGLGVPPAHYTVRMYSFTGDSSGRTATEISSKALIVTK
jgi:hypothetical protein